MRRYISRLAMTTTLLAWVLAPATAARAQVTIEGNTTGSFNSGAAVVGGLSFAGTAFGPFVLAAPGDFSNTNLGTFFLDRSVAYNYNGDDFDLLIAFLQPAAGSSLFSAALRGTVTKRTTGEVNVHFGAPQVVALGGTTLQVEIFDINGQSFGPGIGNSANPAAVDGRITLLSGPGGPATVTPEPVSMALLGTGLAGLGAVARRRRALQE